VRRGILTIESFSGLIGKRLKNFSDKRLPQHESNPRGAFFPENHGHGGWRGLGRGEMDERLLEDSLLYSQHVDSKFDAECL